MNTLNKNLYLLKYGAMGINEGVITTSGLMLMNFASLHYSKESMFISMIFATVVCVLSVLTREYISISIEQKAKKEDIEDYVDLYVDPMIPDEIIDGVVYKSNGRSPILSLGTFVFSFYIGSILPLLVAIYFPVKYIEYGVILPIMIIIVFLWIKSLKLFNRKIRRKIIFKISFGVLFFLSITYLLPYFVDKIQIN